MPPFSAQLPEYVLDNDVRFGVIMNMMTHNAWEGDQPPSFQVTLPMPPGEFEGDEQPFLDLIYWIECHLGRPESSYPVHNRVSFEYVLRDEFFAVWDHNTKKVGFGFVSDQLATLFKTFHM
jgi:hypothetical protein